jgi:hypothetical protein
MTLTSVDLKSASASSIGLLLLVSRRQRYGWAATYGFPASRRLAFRRW